MTKMRHGKRGFESGSSGTFQRRLTALSVTAALFLAAGAQAQTTPRPSGVYAPPVDEREIVITAAVLGGDLFPGAPVPPTACLAAAPPLGAARPGFAIDGATIKGAKGLDKLRKKTRSGTIFVTGGNFAGQRFDDETKLTDICFFGTNFSKSDWRGFAGSGIGFVDSDLSGAKLTGARLPFVLLRDVTMAGADASGADWTNGRLDGGWKGSLKGLKLDGAMLRGFRIECGTSEKDGCPVERDGLSMRGTDLTKASVYSLPLPDVDMTGAVIDQTEIGIDHLGRLATAKLNGAIVVRSRRRAAMFFPAEAKRLAASLAGTPTSARGASRICANPATPIDRAVCAVPGSEMAALVEEVTMLGSAAPQTPRTVRRRVRGRNRTVTLAAPAGDRAAWLAERDACLTKGDDQDDCLLSAYRARRTVLLGAGGQPSWLSEGGRMLFVSADVPVSSDVAGSPIFDRLRPIMLDAAQSVVMLDIGAGGAIRAKGHTLGGCSIDAGGLAFNAIGAIGLSSSRPGVDGASLLMISGEQMRVLDQGLAAVAGTAMADAVYCRRGGSFAAMRRVRLEQSTLTELWEQF